MKVLLIIGIVLVIAFFAIVPDLLLDWYLYGTDDFGILDRIKRWKKRRNER